MKCPRTKFECYGPECQKAGHCIIAPFAVGERVVCRSVRCGSGLSVGRVYTVKACSNYGTLWFVRLEGQDKPLDAVEAARQGGNVQWYSARHFV